MKNKKRKIITTDKIIFLAIITTIIVTALTLSKYASSVAVSDNAKVATPVITISSNTLQIKMNPQEKEQTYVFNVSNSSEQSKSEVSMEYSLQINSLGNLPLEFELYTYDNEVRGNENLLSGNGSVTKNIIIDTTENLVQSYYLIIKWRDGETSYKFSDVADYVQIVLNSNQKD